MFKFTNLYVYADGDALAWMGRLTPDQREYLFRTHYNTPGGSHRWQEAEQWCADHGGKKEWFRQFRVSAYPPTSHLPAFVLPYEHIPPIAVPVEPAKELPQETPNDRLITSLAEALKPFADLMEEPDDTDEPVEFTVDECAIHNAKRVMALYEKTKARGKLAEIDRLMTEVGRTGEQQYVTKPEDDKLFKEALACLREKVLDQISE